MPRFFTENIGEETAYLEGEDARHVARSLRMQVGEALTLCDGKGSDYKCEIQSVSPDGVTLRVLEKGPSLGEPQCRVRLYQALPKGDKLDFIVQKATELGVDEIVPVITDRCISRPGARSMEKKIQRLGKIALEAAKQSGRGKVPEVLALQSFSEAIAGMGEADLAILFYEEGETPLGEILTGEPRSIHIMVGCEGGISSREAQMAAEQGIAVASLGKRILRCETAPICALSAIFYALGEF